MGYFLSGEKIPHLTEKELYLSKLYFLKRSWGKEGIDVLDEEDLKDTPVKLLKIYYDHLTKKIIDEEEKKREESIKNMAEKIIEACDERFKDMDNTNPIGEIFLGGKDFDIKTPIQTLLEYKKNELIYYFQGEVKQQVFREGFADNVNNIIYLMLKFQLIEMKKDGHQSIEKAINSEYCAKYFNTKKY